MRDEWPPVGVSHDRLVWLAARDGVERRSRHWYDALYRMLTVSAMRGLLTGPTGAEGRTAGEYRDIVSGNMAVGAIVVDRLAQRFDALEREQLRTTKALPEWFWPEYDKAYPETRRTMRERAR